MITKPSHCILRVYAPECLCDDFSNSHFASRIVVALFLRSGTCRWQHLFQHFIDILGGLLEFFANLLNLATRLAGCSFRSFSRFEADLRHQRLILFLQLTQFAVFFLIQRFFLLCFLQLGM